ncbi:hypothetical protein M9Y10_017588 [Tritrichomonas musculus]|uniref:Uncharacterized protein n=1 Tax=Tritrichomonas musculus TaxID=1915356 RepID=A0ABR2HTZ0_9EUKA
MAQPQVDVNLQRLVNEYNSFSQPPVDPNTIINNPVAISRIATAVLNNLRTRTTRASSKTGMDALWHIVLDNQKDVKRRKKAMTLTGAQDIVNKRNAANPNSAPWRAAIEDPNNDGVPDVLIRNGSNNPIYINGYTTARSDWPARFNFYTDYDKAARKQYRNDHDGKSITLPIYLKDKLQYTYNNDFTGNPHDLGNMIGYTIPNGWPTKEALSHYTFPIEKRKSAFARFRDYIINELTQSVCSELVSHHVINITNRNKAALLMKGTGKIWKEYILQRIANRHRMNVDSEPFQKMIKKKAGKQEVDNEVSSLLIHLLHTNGEHWTEDKRIALQRQIWDDFAKALVASAHELTRKEQQEHRTSSEYLVEGFTGVIPQDANYDHPNYNADGNAWHDGITVPYNAEHDGEWNEEDNEAFLH